MPGEGVQQHGSVPNRSWRQKLFVAGKVLVTAGFCVLIYRQVDWPAAWQAMRTVRPVMLVIVLAGMLVNVAVSTWKWKLLLAMHSISFPFKSLYAYYLIGSFFNNFLPSTIGGDGYRIYKTVANPVSKTGAVSAVFMERLTGLLALLTTGYLGALFCHLTMDNEVASQMVFWGTVTGIPGAVLVLAVLRMPPSWSERIIGKVPDRIRTALACLKDYTRYQARFALVLVLSLFFQILLLVLYLVLFREVSSSSISIFAMAVAVCGSTLISLLPVSINGIGLLDGSFIYLLSTFQVPYENGIIVMLLIRLLTYLQSLMGGVLYFIGKNSSERSQMTTGFHK